LRVARRAEDFLVEHVDGRFELVPIRARDVEQFGLFGNRHRFGFGCRTRWLSRDEDWFRRARRRRDGMSELFDRRARAYETGKRTSSERPRVRNNRRGDQEQHSASRTVAGLSRLRFVSRQQVPLGALKLKCHESLWCRCNIQSHPGSSPACRLLADELHSSSSPHESPRFRIVSRCVPPHPGVRRSNRRSLAKEWTRVSPSKGSRSNGRHAYNRTTRCARIPLPERY
jgi:hypothetical protein